MNFGANKMPVEVIKEGAFGSTYFRDIYSGVNDKWYKMLWKESDHLKDIGQKYYCSSYYDVNVNKYGVKCRKLRFWENKGWINEIDLYGWFQWYVRYCKGRRSLDDETQINRWKGIVSRFQGKLVKTVCSYYVTYTFQRKSILYSCLNVNELLAQKQAQYLKFK